jgi:hypothetical protein
MQMRQWLHQHDPSGVDEADASTGRSTSSRSCDEIKS